MIKKEKIVSQINQLEYNSLLKLVFNTYTQELFVAVSFIPIVIYGLNSFMNAFVHIFASMLFSVFICSYYKKTKCLIRFNILDKTFVFLVLILLLIFLTSAFLYCGFCIHPGFDSENKQFYTSYDYFYILIIIFAIYTIGVLSYNYFYYQKVVSTRFKILYDFKKKEDKKKKNEAADK